MRNNTALLLLLVSIAAAPKCSSQDNSDLIRELQTEAIKTGHATWGYWGTDPNVYYDWCNHSNRLIPVYTFGIDLSAIKEAKSVYRSAAALKAIYSEVPSGTVNPAAEYFDQTDIYRLQLAAHEQGKKNIILMIFDGMDWHTTRAAAIYRAGRVGYDQGRGTGLQFQDYRGALTDFGFCVTSPHNNVTEVDVNSQTITQGSNASLGGYDAELGGAFPWDMPRDPGYLLGWNEHRYHAPSDSSNAATAMATGVKTYNGAINVDLRGNQLQTVAHLLQSRFGRAIGVVTSVSISHATPAAAYAHNVSRLDYQDLARDMVGLPSIAHSQKPLPGVDVLLGAGYRERSDVDAEQGKNYVPGFQYFADADLERIDARNGGKYVIAKRTPGSKGADVLDHAVQQALNTQQRLFGIFGVSDGHLPYQTADGDYRPTDGVTPAQSYAPSDISENPSLAEMTQGALTLLSNNQNGFWLMVEAGDVDFGSHDVNIDNTIGAILSGEEAFSRIVAWIEQNHTWNDTALIVTSDHGHGFVLTEPTALIEAVAQNKRE